MRLIMAAAAAVAVLWGEAGSALAVPIQVTLSSDQLTNQPGTDIWSWAFPQLPPLSTPASGALQLEFAFEGGFLRLHDLGGAPSPAQLSHRNDLVQRLASQQASVAQTNIEIAQLGSDIAEHQGARAALAGQVQQSQADLTEAQAELQTAKQSVQTLQIQKISVANALAVAKDERDSLADKIANFLGDLFGGAFQALKDALEVAVDTVTQLTQQLSAVQQQVTSAQTQAETKQSEVDNGAAQTQALETALDTLDGAISLLQTAKSAAEGQRSLLTTLISVTEQELAQLPEDANAEAVSLTLDGPSGNPIPLFGQFLLDVVAGDPDSASPFFQGVFENAQSQHLAYADMTPTYVDLAGFTLVLDLFGAPGQSLSLYGFTFQLLADEISIVSRAGAVPVPEPATIMLLGGGIVGLMWMRRLRLPHMR